jgi:hypothetical protein
MDSTYLPCCLVFVCFAFIIIFKNPEGSRAEPFKINGKNGEIQN